MILSLDPRSQMIIITMIYNMILSSDSVLQSVDSTDCNLGSEDKCHRY